LTEDWRQAVLKGNIDYLDHLVHQGADINAKDRYGQTGLMIAAMHGLSSVVQYLVDQGAELNLTAKYHLTALMLAVINGHVEIVRTLVTAGADQSFQGSGAPGFHEKTAIDLANEQNRPDLVEALAGPKNR
jgi:ankyrin repeat protein